MKNTHYLYLIEYQGLFKIGYTRDPKQRFSTYRTHNPQIKFLCYAKVEDKSLETILHLEILKRGYKRANQPEWFIGSPPTVKEFLDMVSLFNERSVNFKLY